MSQIHPHPALGNDLFAQDTGRYPHHPGHKGGDTSRDAARRIAPKARTMRAKVLGIYVAAYPAALLPDEAGSRHRAAPCPRPGCCCRPRR